MKTIPERLKEIEQKIDFLMQTIVETHNRSFSGSQYTNWRQTRTADNVNYKTF